MHRFEWVMLVVFKSIASRLGLLLARMSLVQCAQVSRSSETSDEGEKFALPAFSRGLTFIVLAFVGLNAPLDQAGTSDSAVFRADTWRTRYG